MTIDVHQLPIPDWGLICAKCRYPLAGLNAYRCPECGLPFRIEEIVQTWTRLRQPRFDGTELPLPDFGFECRRCGATLAGAASRACPKCSEPFNPADFQPSDAWFVIDQSMADPVPLPGLESLLLTEQVPFTRVQGKMLRELLGSAAMSMSLSVPTEFYFEIRALLQQTAGTMASNRGTGGEWRCPKCQEQVPEHFDLCWNCETTRSK